MERTDARSTWYMAIYYFTQTSASASTFRYENRVSCPVLLPRTGRKPTRLRHPDRQNTRKHMLICSRRLPRSQDVGSFMICENEEEEEEEKET